MTSDSLKIITNGYVLTCDPENRGGRYTLLVRNGRIAEIADSADVFTYLHPYAEVVDATGRLIIPGFVNAHFHSESILLRARTQGLHLGQWQHDIRFREASQKLLEPSSIDDLRTLYLTAYFGHLKSGTTCVGEFGPPVDGEGLSTMLDAISRTEVRSVVTLQNWSQITRAKELDKPAQRFMMNLGRPQDFTVYTFESISRTARELKSPIIAHIAEQREEVDEVRKNFQKSIIALLREFNTLQQDTILVHLNHLTENEVVLLKRPPLSAVVSPRSTAFKQTGYPALRHLVAHDVQLSIGTDWSNLDMFKELRFLHELPLLVPGLRMFKGVELLRMATINGAHALGVASDIGSIETGKKADLTFLDIRDVRVPHLNARFTSDHLAELIVNHLSTEHVSDVMIGGEFYLTRGQIMTMSEEDIAGAFSKTCEAFFPGAGWTADQLPSSYGGKPRLVSFTFNQKPPLRDASGFEEGRAVTPAAAEHSDSSSQEPKPPRPELAKDVRRVFGEDDDF